MFYTLSLFPLFVCLFGICWGFFVCLFVLLCFCICFLFWFFVFLKVSGGTDIFQKFVLINKC